MKEFGDCLETVNYDQQMKMTSRQYLMLGEDPPGVRLELANGEISVNRRPSYDHSLTDTRLGDLLVGHVFENELGEVVGAVDTIFDDYNVRRPDIIFIAKGRLHLPSGKVHGIH